jgi:hypothetical protein
MIYSVWNQGRGVYDYYQTPEVQEVVNTPMPKHLASRTGMFGVSPNRASWPLPSNAKPMGSGEYARGRVASRGGSLGLGDFVDDVFFGNPIVTVAIGVGGYFAWKKWFR